MAFTQIKIDWDAKPYINQARAALNEVVKEVAEATAEDAKRNLERWAPYSTGTLASQIDVRASKFEDGGWIVEAQGTGNYAVVNRKTPIQKWNPGRKTKHWVTTRNRYYASFVELGTSKMEGLAYLRKALRRNRYRMRKLFERAIGAIVR